jgi:hypothetical protein
MLPCDRWQVRLSGGSCAKFVGDGGAIHHKDLGCSQVCDGIVWFEFENGASKGWGQRRNGGTV